MEPRGHGVGDLVPFVHVGDLARSIAFYELLGFEVRDTYRVEGRLQWVALESGRAQLMLQLASAPIDPRQQAVLFYLYTEDLDGLREHLLASGVAAGPIVDGSPGPERELGISDPDGYCLMIAESESEPRARARRGSSRAPRRSGPLASAARRISGVLQVVRAHHGGFAVGASAWGRGLWVQREPHCHRWSIWRTRATHALAGDGPAPGGETLGGVREPRRPGPQGRGGQIALERPSP